MQWFSTNIMVARSMACEVHGKRARTRVLAKMKHVPDCWRQRVPDVIMRWDEYQFGDFQYAASMPRKLQRASGGPCCQLRMQMLQ